MRDYKSLPSTVLEVTIPTYDLPKNEVLKRCIEAFTSNNSEFQLKRLKDHADPFACPSTYQFNESNYGLLGVLNAFGINAVPMLTNMPLTNMRIKKANERVEQNIDKTKTVQNDKNPLISSRQKLFTNEFR